jgi:hypothetical protein
METTQAEGSYVTALKGNVGLPIPKFYYVYSYYHHYSSSSTPTLLFAIVCFRVCGSLSSPRLDSTSFLFRSERAEAQPIHRRLLVARLDVLQKRF